MRFKLSCATLQRVVCKRLTLGGIILCQILVSTSVLALNVTVSIPPLAGIIAPLLGDKDSVHVLLKQGVSPHGFQLRPSHLRTLHNSDLVISVGGGLDAWIEKPVQSMNKPHITMISLPQIHLLPVRTGGLWEKVSHDSSHGHDHAYTHEQQKRGGEKKFPPPDNHIWLSVDNAVVLIKAVSQQLQQLAPNQSQAIAQRTQQWLAQIKQTNAQVNALLAPVASVPYLVLHDAFQYFEKQYHLNGVGTIRLNPELPPSLKRIQQLRERIQAGKVSCIFKEPQFSAKRLQAVTSGLSLKIGTLDPMLATHEQSKVTFRNPLYTDLLLYTAKAFLHCLSDGKGKGELK